MVVVDTAAANNKEAAVVAVGNPIECDLFDLARVRYELRTKKSQLGLSSKRLIVWPPLIIIPRRR